jgi:16S rRNA (guanine527-N7)-methyltransferase
VPEAAQPGLLAYLGCLGEWSARVSLTAARGPRERILTLVAPVLPLLSLVEPGRVLDLGSGNGSPGLVLALLRPELEITLVEPRARRWAFLREAARAAGRPEIQVFRGRHDAWPGPPAHTVLLRGLRLPLVGILPLVEPGGRVIVMGRPPAPEASFHEEAGLLRGGHVYRRST